MADLIVFRALCEGCVFWEVDRDLPEMPGVFQGISLKLGFWGYDWRASQMDGE